MNFATQLEKDKAVAAQQKVVNEATPAVKKDATDELEEIKAAEVAQYFFSAPLFEELKQAYY